VWFFNVCICVGFEMCGVCNVWVCNVCVGVCVFVCKCGVL